ncbi:MAG: zinc-dependent metalloprotease [Rubricoccaceae bacterium]
MLSRFYPFVALAILMAGCSATAPSAPATNPTPPASSEPDPISIEAKTKDMEAHDGFVPVYFDATDGKVWLEIRELDTDLLYVNSLAAGLGSNDIGLDRSQLGGERVVRFERVGPRVLMVQPNLRYRANSDNAAERLAVEDAFASSVVWGFDIGAETDRRVLIDATDFVVRDAHGVVNTLRRTGQGSFSLDKRRSAPVPSAFKAFPRNTELEARLTFASSNPGRFVRDVAADPSSPTVRIRHSFVQLPDDGYEPRAFHPASGYFPSTYADYAVPIGEDMTQRWITRHRLECADAPGADGLCTPVEPIVYYLDPGTPEPVRTALLDGARWWSEAFEAAGFRDGYRVEVRPDSVDPLDVRYSTIQWVHRATRGWSYGSSVNDPRTGEILKGHVSLGSLRVRQDYLLAEGLLAPYTGNNSDGFPSEAEDPMLQLALARLRQLSAHEVGHTIGLAHNFAASTQDRASVMDYPAPLARLRNGQIDISDAYDVGIGEWDIQAVRYGYAHDASTPAEVIAENRQRGLRYLTDNDARPVGAATPIAALWDNGTDPVQALRDEMAVRRVALDAFGEATIRQGRPMAMLEEVLVPLYLRHRYQVDGTAHVVGGVNYAYTERGERAAAPTPVSAPRQLDAIDALLETVTPSALALPEAARTLIPPRPPGYWQNRELFDGRTGLTFDPLAPAETAAALTFTYLLNADRAARLVIQNDLDSSLPGFTTLLVRADDALSTDSVSTAYEAQIQRSTWTAWVDALIELAADSDAAVSVRAQTEAYLAGLAPRLQSWRDDDRAHGVWLAGEIERFLNRDYDPELRPNALTAPPGSPIGQ